MPSKSKVYFFFEKPVSALRDRSSLKIFIASLFRREGKRLGSLNYIFCTDKKLLQINQEFLGHDYYTDIITFDLSEGEEITAEIYISADRVKDNARTLGSSFKAELHRVIFHGALHLCGYRDKTKDQIQQMRKKENQYLLEYF